MKVAGRIFLLMFWLLAAISCGGGGGDSDTTLDCPPGTHEENGECLFDDVELVLPEGGLLGYWPFSGDASDASGHGGDAYPIGVQLTEDRRGNKDFAYYFDGQDDRIKLDGDLLDELSILTIAFWIKTNDRGADKHFLSAANPNFFNELLIKHSNGIVTVIIREIANTWKESTPINDNRWHHIALVRDAANVKLYLDGVFQDESNLSPEMALIISDGGFWLGGDQDCVGGCWEPDQQYKGAMDDLIIYSRALNASEISQLYQML